MKKNKKLGSILFVSLVFFFIYLMLFFFSKSKFESSKQSYFISQTEEQKRLVHSVLDGFADSMQGYFNSIVLQQPVLQILAEAYSDNETKSNIARVKLYRQLYDKYEYLKTKGVLQFHFHTPDSKSFLRFHYPHKFGDSLVGLRYTVEYANTNLKPIIGFESGRVVSGFRAVYPIVYNGKHFGSVELSIPMTAFKQKISSYYRDRRFILLIPSKDKKKLFLEQYKLYTISPIDENWIVEDPDKNFVNYTDKNNTSFTKLVSKLKYVDNFVKNLKNGKHESIAIRENNLWYVITVTPLFDINNNLTGNLISFEKSDILKNIYENYILDLLFSLIFTLSIIGILIFLIFQNNKMSNQNKWINLIMDNLYDGIFVLDKNGVITFINNSVERLLKYSKNDLVGKDSHSLFHHHINREECKIFSVIKNKRNYLDREIFYTKCGNKLTVDVATVYFEMDKEPYSVVIFRDISKQIAYENILINLREEAQSANDAKSRFLAMVSHELRTPLNGILGAVDILKSSNIPTKFSELLDIVDDSSNRLLNLVNDLLDFEKITKSEFKLNERSFLLKKSLERVYKMFLTSCNKKGLKYDLLFDDNFTNCVIGDQARFEQVLINLLSNAIKFTKKGYIKLIASSNSMTDERVVVEIKVKDSGIGIKKEFLETIFEPFTQVESGLNRKYSGTGLGLSISKKLAKHMDGDLFVDSEYGKGSTFIFKAILKKADCSNLLENVHNSNIEKLEDINLNGLKVLIVEDDITNQVIISKILNSMGCKTDIAVNGKIAVEMVKSNFYDLVLMDIQMPVMDGIDATKIIISEREDLPNKDIKIVCLSANVSKEIIAQCIDVGMYDSLPKPVTRKSFVELFKKLGFIKL